MVVSMDFRSFEDFGLPEVLCQSILNLGWKNPTEVQTKSIPYALQKKDIVVLAETGSGKTGAFAIPILSFLIKTPCRCFAIVLAPTRELALQINDVFDALGSSFGLVTACLVGGIAMVEQALQLAKGPHVLIATPGRLLDHLQNTRGFTLRTVKIVVFDEADRLLSMDFEKEINHFITLLPADRNTYLFSATMNSKVYKLQKSVLYDPVEVAVSQRFQTPQVIFFFVCCLGR
jgi:ATP-dependent RNA helicase DDX47/RRP3